MIARLYSAPAMLVFPMLTNIWAGLADQILFSPGILYRGRLLLHNNNFIFRPEIIISSILWVQFTSKNLAYLRRETWD